jgi:peptidoglycan/LPS O-acetylase OafA/YrhL
VNQLVRTNFRTDLQALRGIALVAVLLFHAKKSTFSIGYLGVDAFFVISGFVVTPLIFRIFESTSCSSTVLNNLFEFYRRRFLRLIPSLVATLTLSAALVFLLAPIQDHEKNFKQGFLAIFSLANFGATQFSDNYFSPNPNPFIHTWSLSVEEQIYVFLPLFFLFISRFARPKPHAYKFVLLGLFLFSFVLFLLPNVQVFIYQPFFGESSEAFIFFSPLSRLWEFIFGSITYLLMTKTQLYAVPRIRKLSFLVAISGIFLLFSLLDLHDSWNVILTCFFTAVAIFFRFLDYLPSAVLAPLIWLGDRSYSIYLLHMPLIYLAKHSQFLEIRLFSGRILQTVIAIALSIGIGAIFYSKVENRFRVRGDTSNLTRTDIKGFLGLFFFCIILFLSLIITPYRSLLGDLNIPQTKVDAPWSFDEECLVLGSGEQQGTDLCKYLTNPKDKRVLLFGDSHAASYSKLFAELSSQIGFNLFISTESDCPFNLQGDSSLATRDVCLQNNLRLRDEINSGRFDMVFYAQRARAEDKNELSLHFLSQLSLGKSSLVVIGMTPEYIPVSSVIGNLLNLSGTFNAQVMDVNSRWKFKVEDYGYTYLDIFPKLCDQNECRTKDNGTYLYFDDNHLSYYGTLLQRNALQDLLMTIKSQPVKSAISSELDT